MVCDSICNCFGNMVGCVADEVKAVNRGIGNCCQRIGLPRDTVSKAVISFVASAIFTGTIALCFGAALSTVPWAMLTVGTVAATASLIYAIAVSLIRHSCNKPDIAWWGQILLSTAVLISAALIVSTFLPFHFSIIGMIITAAIATLINHAVNGYSGKYPLDKSAFYLL
jgi:hypothetical protein